MRRFVNVLIVFAAAVGALQAQSYRFGRVWDGNQVLSNAVIVVENDRIKSVATSSDDAINMTRYTAVPGLIDVHTHLTHMPASVPRMNSSTVAAFVSRIHSVSTFPAASLTAIEMLAW